MRKSDNFKPAKDFSEKCVFLAYKECITLTEVFRRVELELNSHRFL